MTFMIMLATNIWSSIYLCLVSIIGTIVLISSIVSLIKFIRYTHIQRKCNDIIKSKIEKSKFTETIFQPLTAEEKEQLKKNGKVESKLDVNMDTMELTKKDLK